MKTTISLQCIDKTLQPLSLPKLTSGGRKEVRVEFTFDGMWDGYGKTAIFYRDKSMVIHVLLENNACVVPEGIMAKPGKLYVGVYGASGETTRTSEVLALTVAQGAILGASDMDPAPDVYQQILSAHGLLKAQVTNLSTLKEGSTTGDAELQDIRLGADGLTYKNAGEAVRSQFASLSKTNRVTAANTTQGYYVLYSDGSLGAHANYAYVAITVRSGEKYYISDTSNVHVAFFGGERSKENYISGCLNESYVVVPLGATLMTVSVNKANVGNLQVYTKLANDDIFDGEITRKKLAPELQAEMQKTAASVKKTVTVGAAGDYPTILGALLANQGDTRVLVLPGTYDVHDEYIRQYGSEYFTDYTGYAGSADKFDAGLYLYGGCELIGIGEVNITFDYQGDNDNVRKYFSPLNTTQNNVVENINFHIGDGSCRYIIHDDFASEGGTNIFRSCTFDGASHLTTSMGCGMGAANTYIIEGCCFTGNTGIDIAYHNGFEDGVNKVIVRDCHCTGAIRGAHYGPSVNKSKMIVSGCKATRVYLIHGDEATYPNENIELVAWNNDTAQQ